jgi:carboxyl-terminal processing protease
MPILRVPSELETMKKLLLIFVLLFGSHALASPAQDLFDEVSYYLVLNYGGVSKVDVRTLPDKYQVQLEAACIGMANTCPEDKAFSVIQAMLSELGDEHTGFYANLAKQFAQLQAGTGNNLSLGIRLTFFENTVFIGGVQQNSPAAEAGLQRADQITHINFEAVKAKTFAAAWADLNTNGGYLAYSRQGKRSRVRLEPMRLTSELPSLQMRPDGIAVLKIPDFFGRGQGSIANQVHQLLAGVKNSKGVILELRDNPGGFVADCTGVSAAFLENAQNRFVARTPFGTADYFYENAKIWFRRANTQSTVFALTSDTRYTNKVVVLQNKGSASCSEFVSSNLQVAKRATILGEVSAGVANTSTSGFFIAEKHVLLVSLNTRVDVDNKPFASTVTPDELIPDNLTVINKTGKDAILERALEILNMP